MGDRESTQDPSLRAPLFPDPAVAITNETKAEFVQRFLQHKLVLCIQEQAAAFREGLTEVHAHTHAQTQMHAHVHAHAHATTFCDGLGKVHYVAVCVVIHLFICIKCHHFTAENFFAGRAEQCAITPQC